MIYEIDIITLPIEKSQKVTEAFANGRYMRSKRDALHSLIVLRRYFRETGQDHKVVMRSHEE